MIRRRLYVSSDLVLGDMMKFCKIFLVWKQNRVRDEYLYAISPKRAYRRRHAFAPWGVFIIYNFGKENLPRFGTANFVDQIVLNQ